MNKDKEMSIELKPEVAKGSYSNMAIITHSQSEFVLDFATILPGIIKPEVTNRIIMTPEHAKRLLMALNDNIVKYEEQNGVVSLSDHKASFPINTPGGGAKS